jgi:hypothetical protein
VHGRRVGITFFVPIRNGCMQSLHDPRTIREDNTGFSSGKLLPFYIRPYCMWRTPTIVHLRTPSSVSKECSQAYINCQNLLSLSLNTNTVGFVFHFKSATLVEVLWPRRPSDLFHRNTLAAKSKTWGLDRVAADEIVEGALEQR